MHYKSGESELMNLYLSRVLLSIRSSFWFIPILLSICAILAAFFILDLDTTFKSWGIYKYFSTLKMPIETARLVLATIAGAMITVVSLVFSMTLVALILVSQQLGPRILTEFMDDRPTQITLGLFNATFVFSLIVLMRIDQGSTVGEVKGLTVAFAMLLTITSIVMLIHFIHHMATRIQADVIISELGKDLLKAANALNKTRQNELLQLSENDLQQLSEKLEGYSKNHITLANSGYIQQLDTEAVCKIATEKDLIIKLNLSPGRFILKGLPVMTVYHRSSRGRKLSKDDNRNIVNSLSVSEQRTPEASLNYEINAITEIALRALSSGINDPQTAIFCINRLAEGLACLAEQKDAQHVLQDSDGNIRIIFTNEPFSKYLKSSYDGILQASTTNFIVLDHMVKILDQLISLPKAGHQKDLVKDYRSKIEKHLREMQELTKIR